MKRLLAILIMVHLCIIGKADWANDFSYTYYGIEEGLCNEYVIATYLDSEGYLWVCTSNGLDRFDGYSFVHFHSRIDDPARRIKGDFLYGVAEDFQKNIWTVSNNGLLKIDKLNHKTVFPEDMGEDFAQILSSPFVSILSNNDKCLWVLEDKGVLRVLLDDKGNVSSVTEYTASNRNQRYMAIGKGVLLIGGPFGVEEYHITADNDLIPSARSDYEMIAGIKDISYILTNGNYIWLGTATGLYEYNSNDLSLHNFRHSDSDPRSLSGDHVTCLALDDSGDLIVGSSKGIDRYFRDGSFSHMSQDRPHKSPNTNYINNITIAKDGTMWVGTLVGGINRISPKRIMFTDLLSVDQGVSNIISCSKEDKDGNLFMGILGKGLGIRMKGEDKVSVYSLMKLAGISQNDIFAISQDNDGNYWFCTRGDGLVFMEKNSLSNPRLRTYTVQNSDLKNGYIFDMIFDKRRNGLWMCSRDELFFMDMATKSVRKVSVTSDASVLHRFFFLYLDKDDQLWVGGYGMYTIKLNNENSVRDTYKAVFRPNLENLESSYLERLSSMTQAPDGTIYISSSNNGMYKLQEDGSFKNISFSSQKVLDNTPSTSISKILSDASGDIWIGSTNGVYHYNKSDGLITYFSTKDGLPSSNCYINSGCTTGDGKVLFGTNNGLVMFDATYSNLKTEDSKTYITAVSIDDRLILWPEHNVLNISPSCSSFEIFFSTLNLSQSERIWYYYYLENDDSHRYITHTNSIRYNNLKPGRYTLRVYSTQSIDSWSDNYLEVKFHVRPKLIQMHLFWIAIIAVIAGLAGALVVNRIKRKSRIQKALQKQVAEKTADLTKAMNDIVESRNSIKKQNVMLEEQKAKLEEYSASIEKVNREKLMLYTNLTHEFKTPLSLILGPVSELSGSCQDKSIKPSLGIIERNAKYLLSLVNQILDLRKVDSGKITVKKDTVSIPSSLSIFSMDYNHDLKGREISFATNLHLISNNILSDSDILFKILSNLLSNASKYTPDGGKITLNVAQFKTSAENRLIQYISVSNTGSYIPKEESDKIFDCFYKSENSQTYGKSSQGSTGIGLYLVRNLVSLLGGIITVKSSPKTGTSFRLYFPTDIPSGDIDYTEPQEQEISDTPTLLMVEDNDDMRTYIKGILASKFRVVEAINGEIGYELAKQTIPDFIISDLMMPVCDGLQFCKLIREDSNLSHIPLMMLTALAGDETRLESYKQGANAFLVKPFSKEMLLTRIDNIMSEKKHQQEELTYNLENSYATVNIDRSDKAFMEQLMNILKENYADSEFSVPKLQSLLCMSMTPFYKKVTSLTGLTPAMLIRRYRLQTAKTLIENSQGKGVNVSEIAYMVGFNDPKYFSKCFHKEYNIKPSSLIQGSTEEDL